MGGLPRPFWVLWTGTLITRMGLFVIPFLTIYLTQKRGLSMAQAGATLMLYGIGGAIAGPVGGFFADHFGRRRTMVASLALAGSGMIALGLAQRIEVIAPGVFLLGLVSEMYRPAMLAALGDLVPPADRVRAFGLIYWAINLGVSIGLTFAGMIATVSYFLLFLGDGLTTLVFAVLVWRGVPETRPQPQAHEQVMSPLAGFLAPYRDPPFAAFMCLSFLIALIFMQHMSTLPLDMIAHGISPASYGVVIALNGALIVLVQPFLAPALAKRNRSLSLAAGATVMALGFGLNALARTTPIYAASVLIWTLGEIAVLPVAHSVVTDVAPPLLRGRYQGAYTLAFGLAACAAPAVGTLVLQRFGATVLWSACLAIGLVVAAGQLALARPLTRAASRTHSAAARRRRTESLLTQFAILLILLDLDADDHHCLLL